MGSARTCLSFITSRRGEGFSCFSCVVLPRASSSALGLTAGTVPPKYWLLLFWLVVPLVCWVESLTSGVAGWIAVARGVLVAPSPTGVPWTAVGVEVLCELRRSGVYSLCQSSSLPPTASVAGVAGSWFVTRLVLAWVLLVSSRLVPCCAIGGGC